MPEDFPERPFLWSEIHSLAKRRLADLDTKIREEISKVGGRIPNRGADRHQFLLLLEEKANDWANRARDAYLDCLQEIGREPSYLARVSVFNNGLIFFLSDDLRNFLIRSCGCVKLEPRGVSQVGKPRAMIEVTQVPNDLNLQLGHIIERIKARISTEMHRIGNGESPNNLAEFLRLMTTPTVPSNPLLPSAPPPPLTPRLPIATPMKRESPPPRFVISDDSRSVRIDGVQYLLSPGQGKMLRVLWDAYQKDKQSVSRAALRKAIGSSSSDPRDTWRNSPLWGSIVVSNESGFYRLKLTETDV